MARFFLNVVNGRERVRDLEEREFQSLAAARTEALESARELIGQCLLEGLPLGLKRHFEIVDAEGRRLAQVSFAEAIPNEDDIPAFDARGVRA